MTDLPRDTETERIVLGTLLAYPERYAELAGTLADKHFSLPLHLRVFQAIKDAALSGMVPDAVAIAARLEDEDKAKAGELLDYRSPRGLNLEGYVSQLVAVEDRRTIVRAGYELLEMAGGEVDTATASVMLGSIAKRMAGQHVNGHLQRLDLATILENTAEEPIPWAVHGWLAEGEAAILAGEWGSGKSLVALDLAVSLAAGIPWMGYAHIARPFRVLVVDEENGPRLARHRMRQIIAGRNLAPETAANLPIAYLCRNGINLDDPKGMASLKAEIERHKPEFLVMDSLVRFFRGRSENDNTDMSAFFGERIRPLMRDHNLGVIMLDHMGKPSKDGNQDPGHRVRGASDKPGFVDELWALAGERDQTTRTLTHEKTRWDDLQAPVQTSWHKSEDGTAAWIEAKELRRGCEDAIREVLEGAGAEGRCHGEIVELVKVRGGYDAKHVRRTLGKMHGQGSVRRKSDGGRRVRYWVSEHAPIGAE